MFNAVASALVKEEVMLPGSTEELKGKIPVGKLGRPEEIAEVVVLMIVNGYVSNKVWMEGWCRAEGYELVEYLSCSERRVSWHIGAQSI